MPAFVHAARQEFANNPMSADARANLANALSDLATAIKPECPKQARQLYEEAVSLEPRRMVFQYNLAVLLADTGHALAALEIYARIINGDDQHWIALACCNSGAILRTLNRARDALPLLERALQLQPDHELTRLNLASALVDVGVAERDPEITEKNYRRALDLCVPCVDSEQAGAVQALVLFNLGVKRQNARRPDRAATYFHLCLRLGAGAFTASALLNLGVIAKNAGNLLGAKQFYERALDADPLCAAAINNLGVVFRELDEHEQAREAFLKAKKIDNTLVDVHNNIGVLLRDEGRPLAALHAFDSALALDPDNLHALSNRLLTLHYDLSHERELGHEHDAAAQVLAHWCTVDKPWHARAVHSDRLRVGLLSADFRVHSVLYFVLSLFRFCKRVELVCVSNVSEPDESTALVRSLAARWLDIAGRDTADAVERVRRAHLDVLLDLSGHTAGNRLDVMANRCAPVQATYAGYPDQTGLASVEYRLVDRHTDPPTLAPTRERLVYLERCFVAYTPPPDVPPVAEPPAVRNGFVTFGSFNTLSKITPHVLRVWAGVLHRCHRSRLVLKSKALSSARVRHDVLTRLAQCGVAPHRVTLLPLCVERSAHLASYARLDVALDTFPYSGAVTTCEALLMGVPLVTLYAGPHSQRVSGSLLRAAGLDEWCCDTPERFVERACELARDTALLRERRRTLRPQLLASTLCDGEAHAERFERAMHQMCENYAKPRSNTISRTST